MSAARASERIWIFATCSGCRSLRLDQIQYGRDRRVRQGFGRKGLHAALRDAPRVAQAFGQQFSFHSGPKTCVSPSLPSMTCSGPE